MGYRNGIQNYQETQFQTANPARLITMLYERLYDELENAKRFIEEKKFFDKGNAILKCQDIVLELNNSLNLEAGQIALNLQALYLFMFKELNWINLHNDVEKLEKITQVVDNLKSAWEMISGNQKGDGKKVGETDKNLVLVR